MYFPMTNAFQMPQSYYGGGLSRSSFGGRAQTQNYGYGSSSLQAASSSQYYSQLMSAQQNLYSGWGQFGGFNGSFNQMVGNQPGYANMQDPRGFALSQPSPYNFGSAFSAYQGAEFGNNFGNPFGMNPLSGYNLSDQSLANTFFNSGNGTLPTVGSGFDLGGLTSGLKASSLLSTAFSLFF